nr:alpha-latrotoxin-Lt1a-like [Quercus suber]
MEDNEHRLVVEELYKQIMTGEWDEVVETYGNCFDFVHKAVLNMLGETALHLAVSHGPENSVEQLVAIISKKPEYKKALEIKNTEGNTPLHLAATTGSLRKCICIAEANPSLGNARNNTGESPLFLAALLGKTDIFVCLRFICQGYLENSYYRKDGGETILHCAIKRECWDLAYQILLLHKELATLVDEHGSPPLYLLANKPAAFRSGCHLGSWNKIIYHC